MGESCNEDQQTTKIQQSQAAQYRKINSVTFTDRMHDSKNDQLLVHNSLLEEQRLLRMLDYPGLINSKITTSINLKMIEVFSSKRPRAL